MKIRDEIINLILTLDVTLAGLTDKWKAAPPPEKAKWWDLIMRGLDERLELMRMRGPLPLP